MATVYGSENPDILDAADGVTEGYDIIYGLGGADEIYGLGGDDVLIGGAGGDYFDGGEGTDTVDYIDSASPVFVNLITGGVGGDANGDIYVSVEIVRGSNGSDFLVGSDVANWVDGAEGNNTIDGKGGNDTLRAGSGADTINGGEGDDYIAGGPGADVLSGGNGIDTIQYFSSAVTVNLALGTASDGDTFSGFENMRGSGSGDTLIGDAYGNDISGFYGNDILVGAGGNDTLWGDRHDDTLQGGTGADTLNGGPDSDTASYSDSTAAITVNLGLGTASGGTAEGDTFISIENLAGSSFADQLIGSDAVNNVIGGLAGNDILDGKGGDDTLSGGEGDDKLLGSAGADTLIGGGGSDSVDYALSASAVLADLKMNLAAGGDAAGDTYNTIENLLGSALADSFSGDAAGNILLGRGGDDLLVGRAGNDTLVGGAGADEIYGGLGVDIADYRPSAAAVQINLGAGTAAGGDAAGDVLAGIETLYGSGFADTLTGDAGNNRFLGGGGKDVMNGGLGNDTFAYNARAEGGDAISGFSNVAGNNDVLAFLGTGFGNHAAGGILAAEFQSGTASAALNASVRFFYETDTGLLRYDSDGSGATAAVLIAAFTGNPAVTAADIMFF